MAEVDLGKVMYTEEEIRNMIPGANAQVVVQKTLNDFLDLLVADFVWNNTVNKKPTVASVAANGSSSINIYIKEEDFNLMQKIVSVTSAAAKINMNYRLTSGTYTALGVVYTHQLSLYIGNTNSTAISNPHNHIRINMLADAS